MQSKVLLKLVSITVHDSPLSTLLHHFPVAVINEYYVLNHFPKPY